MKVGVTLKQFGDDAEAAISGAQRAEALGLDGVFVFDHLWPLGSPERPIIAALPMLGALAAETSTVAIGSLVMRMGLLPDGILISELLAVHELSGGRLVAGLGTGDRLSAEENLAYGVPYPPANERRAELARCSRALQERGVPVWIGAGASVAPATRKVAEETGAALNVWETPAATVAALQGVEVTWGGPVPGPPDGIARRLRDIAGAGATWAVLGWPDSLEDVAEARRLARV